MTKKIITYANLTMEVCWLLALVSVPIYFNIYTSRVFEPDKITLFRSLVLVMGFAWLVKAAAMWAADRASVRQPINRRGKEEAAPAFPPDGEVVGPDPRPYYQKIYTRPLMFPAYLLCLIYLISTVFSVVPGVSWWGSFERLQGTYTFFSYVMMFLVMAFNLRERRQIERLITFIMLAAVPITLYGILQHNKADPLPWQGDVAIRVTSTMGNAIFISAYLIMIVPLALYRLITTGAWLLNNKPLASRDLTGRNRDVALSWFVLYVGFIIFQIGLFYVMLNLNANYRPETTNVAQAGSGVLQASSQAGADANSLTGNSSLGPWYALPVGIVLSFGLYFLFTVKRKGTDTNYTFRLFEFGGYLAIMILTVLVIVYSKSRGPEAGLLLGLYAIPPILFARKKMWKWLGGWLGIGILAAGFLLLFNLPDGSTPLEPVFQVLRKNPEIARFSELSEVNDGTGKVRQLIWKTVTELFTDALKNEPIRAVIGYGPESLYYVSPLHYQPELGNIEARNAIPDRSHNGYLDALATTGILGILAYVFFVLAFFYYGIKFLRETKRFDYQVLIACLMGAMLAHQMEIQTGIQVVSSWMMFWTCAALLVVLGGLIRGSYANKLVGRTADGTPAEVVAVKEDKIEEKREDKKEDKSREKVPVGAVASTASKNRGRTESTTTTRSGRLENTSRTASERNTTRSGFVPSTGTRRLVGAGAGGGNLNYAMNIPEFEVKPWFWAVLSAAVVFGLAAVYFFNLTPIVADTVYKQGSNLASINKWEDAFPYLQKAAVQAPSEDRYALYLGQAYLQLADSTNNSTQITDQKVKYAQTGQFLGLAETELLRAQRLAPLNPDHYANLARLYSQWANLDSGRRQEFLRKSITWYQDGLTRAPRNSRIYTELAGTYLNSAVQNDGSLNQEGIKKAIDTGYKSVQVDPQFDFARYVLGDILLAASQPDKAGEQFGKLLELNPSQLWQGGKYPERVRAITLSPSVTTSQVIKALDKKPTEQSPTDWAQYQQAIGLYYYYKSDYANAEQRLTEAAKYAKENIYTPTYLALIYGSTGRPQDAATAETTARNLLQAQPADVQQTVNSLLAQVKK